MPKKLFAPDFETPYTFSPLKVSPAKAKTIFQLPIEQEVFVPSTNKAQRIIKEKAYKKRVDEVKDFLATTFGGFTETSGTGGYYSKDLNRVIKEPATVITSFSEEEDFPKKQKKLFSKLGKWRRAWGQESMGYEFEGDLYYLGKQQRKKRELKHEIRRRISRK